MSFDGYKFMNMMEILRKYDLQFSQQKFKKIYTDKGSLRSTEGHSYIQNFYEKEFQKYKNKKISLLEIGISSGGSLKLWKEYFSNIEKIVGIDIENNTFDEILNIDEVICFFQDAYDYEFAKTIPTFDIIIDDGPHTLETQIKAIELYLPKLNANGIFVIEDLQDDAWFEPLSNKLKEISGKMPSDVKYSYECLDFRKTLNRVDDMMFVVKRCS